jgi:hypothetical protein
VIAKDTTIRTLNLVTVNIAEMGVVVLVEAAMAVLSFA